MTIRTSLMNFNNPKGLMLFCKLIDNKGTKNCIISGENGISFHFKSKLFSIVICADCLKDCDRSWIDNANLECIQRLNKRKNPPFVKPSETNDDVSSYPDRSEHNRSARQYSNPDYGRLCHGRFHKQITFSPYVLLFQGNVILATKTVEYVINSFELLASAVF